MASDDQSPETPEPLNKTTPKFTPVNKQRSSPVTFTLPASVNKNDYIDYADEDIVDNVLEELGESDEITYRIEYLDGRFDTVTFDKLIGLKNGPAALSRFQEDAGSRQKTPDTSSGDEIVVASVTKKTKQIPQRNGAVRSSRRQSVKWEIKPDPETGSEEEEDEESDSDIPSRAAGNRRLTRSAHMQANRGTRQDSRAKDVTFQQLAYSSESSDDMELLQSDVLPTKRKRKAKVAGRGPGRPYLDISKRKPEKEHHVGIRQSERATRNQHNMKEAGLEDVYRSDSDFNKPPTAPRTVGVREVFKTHPSSLFSQRHMQQCDTCGKMGSGPYGPLVYCQGCSLSYHQRCLGPRGSRDHLVTKVGDENFVLQCRRCINIAKKKDTMSPDQAICQSCRGKGPACRPFRARKTPLQEQKERDENEGQDPTTPVAENLINNVKNVLFRCTTCWRAWHYHHLLLRSEMMDVEDDEDGIAAQRHREYTKDWVCSDCADVKGKVSGLVAWRPIDPENYTPGLRTQEVDEDSKEYLVKWEAKSYFQCDWMPGAWTWGVTAAAMRKAFEKRHDNNNLPTMTTEDAIPEEYLRIDIVLDVRFTSIVDTRLEEVDKARIREVDQAYIKYKGLGYEDAVWEKVPSPEDGERWTDYVKAYDDWVMGRYVHLPKASALKIRLEKVRSQEFASLEKKKQPESLKGGELMKYQLDGLNWLYYRWYLQENAILADEMGLGKTIQIIAFLASLTQDHNCFPFLVVVPNSTCPNWRREIKQWAPSLRVVTYFGSSMARSLAYQFEAFPEGSKEMRCHIVVTSYEAASDDSCRRFFKSVPWQGLIVDEGQRLKNDKNILYNALSMLNVPYRILLTGTPLQNNARELFNLLQFLDKSFDAAALELEYAELTKENVPQLHNLIRPFFLRRTKAQVLTFLPPMAQIILPVSMSVVQKKLYMSILAKNAELVKAIFDPNRRVNKAERANLSNILMQLRKCLCHPFVYSKEIEERSLNPAVSHRNLVEASAKLQLLELLLPKLKERGHRVLIFSQFLDMLDIVEDFLDGMEFQYQRLDGTISSLQKQKRIDLFNAKDSELFAFLLSTRAGGIGINLASADTVIIMDPDFNPHQDIQALSRAHRIGQNKKVLCFQLMTRSSAEEKIMQIGRKKMALDHVLIERMDADEDSVEDLESILKYGAADILSENTENEIRYDESSVEKLLDRTQIEDTKAGEDNSAESQFSFARVWANDSGSMVDSLNASDAEEKAPDPTVWEKILHEREQAAASEAAARQEALGRGKRARHAVDYTTAAEQRISSGSKGKDKGAGSDSDSDFQAKSVESVEEVDDDDQDLEGTAAAELPGLEAPKALQTHRGILSQQSGSQAGGQRPFKRANIVWPTKPEEPNLPPAAASQYEMTDHQNPVVHCIACGTLHRQGYCPMKLAGPEYCNLCGLAHFGVSRSCPHIRSETQVREMIAALKQSPEAKYLVDEAAKYLKGVKGAIVQAKKRKEEKATAQPAVPGAASSVINGGQSQQVVNQNNLATSNQQQSSANSHGVTAQAPWPFPVGTHPPVGPQHPLVAQVPPRGHYSASASTQPQTPVNVSGASASGQPQTPANVAGQSAANPNVKEDGRPIYSPQKQPEKMQQLLGGQFRNFTRDWVL